VEACPWSYHSSFFCPWIVGLCQAEFSSHFWYSIAVPDLVWISMCIFTPADLISSKLIKSCSHGNLLLLFVVKVMVWCFVSNSHKVMTALVVMLPSNCCSGDFLCDFKDMKFQFHFKLEDNQLESWMYMCIKHNGLPEVVGGLLYAYLHPPFRADDVSGLVMATAHHCSPWWRWWGCHFVSNSHRVMTALIVILPSDCC